MHSQGSPPTTGAVCSMSGYGGGRGRGRGWYYKEKYGGGRGKRERTSEDHSPHAPPSNHPAPLHGEDDFTNTIMQGTFTDLRHTLQRIDGKGYGAYKDLAGAWRLDGSDGFDLHVDYVQGDAYAAPSRFSVQIPATVAGFPKELYSTPARTRALCDFLTRTFGHAVSSAGADVRKQSGGWAGAKGGDMNVDAPGQYVLQRSSVRIQTNGDVEARFTVGLPARGRTIMGDSAAQILIHNLPKYVQRGLFYRMLDHAALQQHVHTVEDSVVLRDMLPLMGLVAFVGNGAILPRASGDRDQPMQGPHVVPFASPPSLEVEVVLPHAGRVKGMGVREGVSVVVGGGFHGKSTLLNALEVGVYDKIPGDGRELVVCCHAAAKIRAEDGRQVSCVDISPFINNLPFGRPTNSFFSADASGSTSQAANIQEALEAGATLLLVDEDTSATNFMVRDARMQALIAADKEPITPFVARVRALAAQGVSTVLVIGGCGDYFDVADSVVAMDCYQAKDVTDKAKALAASMPGSNTLTEMPSPIHTTPRLLRVALPSTDLKIQTRSRTSIALGSDMQLDLGCVEQLVDASQTRALAEMIVTVSRQLERMPRAVLLTQMLDGLEAHMDGHTGMDALCPTRKLGNMARPRRLELAAALNRLRSAQFLQ